MGSMPIAVSEVPLQSIPLAPPRKRWTRRELEEVEALGTFQQQRIELIEGELIERMPKNRPHADSANMLQAWLYEIYGVRFVNAEVPIDVAPEDNPTNRPEPDIVVFNRGYTGFRSRVPQPQDLALVVEVSDSTLAFDCSTKARLYARAGVKDYWVLDVSGRRMIVHRDPRDGKYQSVQAYSEHESVGPLESPESLFRVGEAFPE